MYAIRSYYDSAQRFYSLSSQILQERNDYYAMLKNVQHSEGNITRWLDWFLNCMLRALETAQQSMGLVLRKADFWDIHQDTELV